MACPDDYDFPMSETFRRGLAAQNGEPVMPLQDQAQDWARHRDPYHFTRGDLQGVLLEQIRDLLQQLGELRRTNSMLNEQLRMKREQGQLQAQPPPMKRKGGVEL